MNFLTELTAVEFKKYERSQKKEALVKVQTSLVKKDAFKLLAHLDKSWPEVLDRDAEDAPVVLKPGDTWAGQFIEVSESPVASPFLTLPCLVHKLEARPDPDNGKSEDSPEDRIRIKFNIVFDGDNYAALSSAETVVEKGITVHVAIQEADKPQQELPNA
ncbi:MAG: hypothetical protein GY700_06610 [Propionibacteriaceae bacterium]|nr:hypothetical protein [Propionibacteriaceae bacterium]